jgi:hydrogenase large subunit
MFCLMEGRHVHPSTLYPGGVGTVPSIQVFTDYLVRLMKYIEFMKRVVPLHDDLFDFFYDALPGYEKVGQRRVLLGCWGSFQDPNVCDYNYKTMEKWGRNMFCDPGGGGGWKAGHHQLGGHQSGHTYFAGFLLLSGLG